MSLSRILSILLQEYYILKRSLEVWVDIFYFSIQTIIVFGFFTTYLTNKLNPATAHVLIIGTLLWEVVRVGQYSVSMNPLWNMWSRNLTNMFISPLSIAEYLIAQCFSGIIKSTIVLLTISLIANYLFHFNILHIGFINLLSYFINLTIFSWSIGIIVIAMIFRFGTRIQAFAWGMVFLFQPLTAALFPVSILPPFVRSIAMVLPPTYVFEAARASLSSPEVDWRQAIIAFILNMIYFVFALIFFNSMFNKSKETGQFARNEG